MRKCLLIGYGNTMRSDDILGPYIVENYDHSNLDDEIILDRKVLAQLDIILAEDFMNYDTVILVDARQDDEAAGIIVKKYEEMSYGPTAAHSSHYVSIHDLMRLAQYLYGAAPECYSVLPKGYDFSVGHNLSENARYNAKSAFTEIKKIIRR
ncbi:hydrogenase maturation protease [candidate division KSB1 bacterium]